MSDFTNFSEEIIKRQNLFSKIKENRQVIHAFLCIGNWNWKGVENRWLFDYLLVKSVWKKFQDFTILRVKLPLGVMYLYIYIMKVATLIYCSPWRRWTNSGISYSVHEKGRIVRKGLKIVMFTFFWTAFLPWWWWTDSGIELDSIRKFHLLTSGPQESSRWSVWHKRSTVTYWRGLFKIRVFSIHLVFLL